MAEDHLGIRDVRFASSSRKEIPEVGGSLGLWWRSIKVRATTELDVWDDVCKLFFVFYYRV
jgi:hypothetical protein